MTQASSCRIEKDLLGERELPADAYFGIHTLRAIENFQITGVPISRHGSLVRALAAVKQAAAEARSWRPARNAAPGLCMTSSGST